MKKKQPALRKLHSLLFSGLAIWFLSPSAQANLPLAVHCTQVSTVQGRREKISRMVMDDFVDQSNPDIHGGLFNAGLCWWKSRLTRSALYLAYFSPDEPKPKPEEARLIIGDLVSMRKIVKIPGFANWSDFTTEYLKEMHEVLGKWQLSDAISGAMRTLNWKLPTSKRTNPNLFRDIAKMREMLEKHGAVPYVLLQVAGVSAHSWLIQKVRPVEFKTDSRWEGAQRDPVAYEVTALDPKVDWPIVFTVRPGDEQVKTFRVLVANEGEWIRNNMSRILQEELVPVPLHLDWVADLDLISKAIQDGCPGFASPELHPQGGMWGLYR